MNKDEMKKQIFELKQRIESLEKLTDEHTPAAYELEYGVDWGRVKQGTEVMVRDHENGSWALRVFIVLLKTGSFKFFCEGCEGGVAWRHCRLVHKKDIPPPWNEHGFYRGQAGYFWDYDEAEAVDGIYKGHIWGYHYRMTPATGNWKHFTPKAEWEAKHLKEEV